jgi:ABC-2 type transport system permease protein
MIQPRLAWDLARKDLKLFLADRRGAALCFGIPIVLASVFGLIFHRPAGTDLRPTVLVVAGDDDPLTVRVVAGLCASDNLAARRAYRTTDLRCLADESSAVVVVLPAGFGRAAKLGVAKPTAKIRLLHHPNAQVESRWVEGVLTEVVLREAVRELIAPLAKLNAEWRLERPFAVEHESVAAAGALSANAYSHSFCGMTLQYLLFWGMDSGLLLLRERRAGIWRRLRAAPVTRTTLVAGKALATALVALAQIALTFAFGAAVFGVTVTGSVAGFAALALTAAVLAAATGLLVAALGGNEARARSVAILAILTLSLLGGLWLPAFLLPRWAQALALALPTTWAARGLEGVIWQGMGLAGALRCAGMLLAFSAAFLAVACWGLARRGAARAAGGGVNA